MASAAAALADTAGPGLRIARIRPTEPSAYSEPQGSATFECHGPKFDVYSNAGAEYAADRRLRSGLRARPLGMDLQQFNNTGCFTETGPQNTGGFLPGGLAELHG